MYNESVLELPDANYSKKGQDVTDSSRMMVAPVLLGEPVVKSQSLEHATARTPKMMKTFDSGSLVLIKVILLKESEKEVL